MQIKSALLWLLDIIYGLYYVDIMGEVGEGRWGAEIGPQLMKLTTVVFCLKISSDTLWLGTPGRKSLQGSLPIFSNLVFYRRGHQSSKNLDNGSQVVCLLRAGATSQGVSLLLAGSWLGLGVLHVPLSIFNSLCIVSLQPVAPLQHQPGSWQTPPHLPQVLLCLQLQMPLTTTHPRWLTTPSLVGELCTPSLSSWETVLSTSGWGRPRPGHCTDKYLKGLVNWMPVLHLVSFCLFLNKDIPRAGYRYQTNSRIALMTGVCGEVSGGIGLSFLVIILGTTACLVEHPYSHPWRYVFKSLSLCHPLWPEDRNFSPRLMMLQCLCLPHSAPQSPADRLLSESQTQRLEGTLKQTKQHREGRQ